MCDLQTNNPLAILPDRLPETVTSWIKEHPSIEVISRDGFTGYRQAITKANRSILQVYDRWHFIQNAKKQLDSFLATMVPSSISWQEQPKRSMKDSPPLTRLEQRIKNRQEQKWLLIQEIKQAYKKGQNISRLAREYELDRRTVRKYINMNGPPSFTRERTKAANPYYDQIYKLEQEGNTVKEIYSILQEQNYKGTFSSVRTIVESIRKKRKHHLSQENAFHLSRKKLSSWL
nr:transposase [Priestia filamentosa]